MPGITFEFVLAILLEHGFELDRQKGSHRTYKGVVHGEVKIVVLAWHRGKDEIVPNTLASIIRQSGLPKRLFRR